MPHIYCIGSTDGVKNNIGVTPTERIHQPANAECSK